jgi:glycosyltransferase involved in cell wall biosynthesis
MRILFISDLYSSPLAPKRGVANGRILRAMRAHASIRVLSPVPWYPKLARRFSPGLKDLIELPASEPDDDGTPIGHPRRLQIPRAFATQAPLYAASLLGPLREAIALERPDVIMTAWAYPDATAVVALGALVGLPVVVRVMGSDINDYAQQAYRRPQIAWAMRRADRIIAVSKALGSEVVALGVDRARVAVIPTGVDNKKFYPVDRDEAAAAIGIDHRPLITVPSRLSREKGITFLLDALAGIPEAHAVLVGDGPEENNLREQARRLGIERRVHFAGFQPEARMKLYDSAADLVCLPSLEEGWPNALMEAFACGCPVVASRVGGVPDIIALTDAGLCAPAGDAEALRITIVEALGRHWDRAQTAERIGAHTLARTAASYVQTCREVAIAR